MVVWGESEPSRTKLVDNHFSRFGGDIAEKDRAQDAGPWGNHRVLGDDGLCDDRILRDPSAAADEGGTDRGRGVDIGRRMDHRGSAVESSESRREIV